MNGLHWYVVRKQDSVIQDSLVYTWYSLCLLKQVLSLGTTRVGYPVSLFYQKMESDQPLICNGVSFFQHDLLYSVQNFSLDCDML